MVTNVFGVPICHGIKSRVQFVLKITCIELYVTPSFPDKEHMGENGLHSDFAKKHIKIN